MVKDAARLHMNKVKFQKPVNVLLMLQTVYSENVTFVIDCIFRRHTYF